MSDRLASGATNKGADFLLELRSEEVPARMQAKARNDLSRLFAECTGEAGLQTGAIDTFSTPRRLVLIARNVAESTEASREELKGPRTSAPPQALEGFLRKTGLTQDQLEDRDGVYFAVVERAGRPAIDFLADTIRRIVAEFPWPKSMRWGDGSLRWVRPLHGIVALLGEEIVPVEIDGIAAGATTVGHRFHHPGPITIGGAADYAEKLRACHVIVDQEERERCIREGAASAAKEAGLTLLPDEGLVVENAGLTEWPVPMLGRFDADFLDVPREVIVLTMRTNQKYFACTNDEGLLAPAFVCVANVAANDGGEAIVEGNRRVLAARLSDARFFWEQDLKVPLEEQAKKLGGIVFHEKLGTVADKVERIKWWARWLVENDRVATGGDASAPKVQEVAELAEQAARLSKADLVTGMVGEFPELQGTMGGYYAEKHQPPSVAKAIRDQYGMPVEHLSVVLALADRLDTLKSFFAIDERPTGSKDPFALRRAAIQAVVMIMRGIRIDLAQVLSKEVIDFLVERWMVQNKTAGGRPDLIAAVRSATQDGDLFRMGLRMTSLESFLFTEDGANLLTAYKRAANILKKENWTGPQVMSSPAEQGIPQTGEEDALVLVDEPILKDAVAEMASGQAGADLPEEKALIAALDAADPKASAAVDAEDFTGAMAALASLRRPIDNFFDHVTVNDPDAAKRERRLNLLMRFRDAVNRVADFSRIEG